MRAVCVAVLLLCGAAVCSAVNLAHLRSEVRSEVNDQAEYLVSPFTPEHEVVNCLAMKAALAAEKPIAKFKVIEDAFKGTCDGHAGITKDQATGIFGWAAFKSQSLADQIETSNALGSRWQDAPCEGSADATFDPDKNLCTDLSRIAVGGGVAKLGEMIKKDEVVAFGHQAFTGLAHVSHLGWGSLWHSQSSPEEKKQFKLKTQRDIVSQIATQAKAWLTHALGKTDPESMILPRWSWNMGRIGHMLADSFSCAHVARLETGEVLFHQDYNFQSGIEHGKHDALGKGFQTHNGVKMAIKHNTEIYKFGIRALNAKYSGAKDAASKVSQASAQMANYIKDHIFKFASPDHGNFDALGCVVKSTVDPAKLSSFKAHICPLKLGSYDATGKNICPDRPRKAETELEGAAAAPKPASNKVTNDIIPSTCFKEGKTYWQKMDGDCEHKVSLLSPTCSKNGDCQPVKGANKCEHQCVCGTKGINECFCVKRVVAKQLKAACIGEPKDLN